MLKRGVKVLRVTDRDVHSTKEQLVMVREFTLRVNDQDQLHLTTTSQRERELAVGYLFSQRLIQSESDIVSISNENRVMSIVTVPPVARATPAVPDTRFNAIDIFRLVAFFQEGALLYKDTSISHSAALASQKEILVMAEDVGHMNAVDKAIGQAVLSQVEIPGLILLTTGKISVPLIQKAVAIGVPVIVSRLAPTDRAYDLANQHKISILGFARGKRFSIYTGNHRIITT